MKEIYDPTGRVKYRIMETGAGVEIYDGNGALKYRYIKASDLTFDCNGALVMRGNIVLDLGAE